MNITQLREKRETLRTQLADVESKLGEQLQIEKTGVIESIRHTMADYGIPIDAIAKEMKIRLKKAKKAVPTPKYKNPKTGETWTGRGRAPQWIASARNRDKFLIGQ